MNVASTPTVHAGVRWAAFTLAGMALISLTTLVGIANVEKADRPLFVLSRLSLPVIVLIGYAYSEFKRVRRSTLQTLRAVRIGQLADSLYFIGFLWTLWALIDSFVIHQLSIANAVFRAFGYALVTTTFGTFLRLMLLQFQHADDIVEVGSQMVETELETFSAKLKQTTESVETFKTATDAALTVWIEAMNRSTASLTAATASVAGQSTALETSVKQVADHTIALAAAQKKLSAEIDSSATSLRTTGDRLREELDASTKGIADVAQTVRGLQQAMRNHEEQMRTATLTGAHRIESAVNGAVDMLEGTAERFNRRLQRHAEQLVAVAASPSHMPMMVAPVDVLPGPEKGRRRVRPWWRRPLDWFR